MVYMKRFALALLSAFVVLLSYTVASKWPFLDAGLVLAIIVGAVVCCLPAGLISAGLVRKSPVAMVLTSQVLSIVLIGIIWQL